MSDTTKLSASDRQAFTDAYRFWERHHDMPNTIEAWNRCSDEVKEITAGYDAPELVRNLLSALYLTLDHRHKQERKLKDAT